MKYFVFVTKILSLGTIKRFYHAGIDLVESKGKVQKPLRENRDGKREYLLLFGALQPFPGVRCGTHQRDPFNGDKAGVEAEAAFFRQTETPQ